MCTLIVLHRCVPGAPLLAAANRDEFQDRPAEGPALRFGEGGPVVAPRDGEAGGTWLGVNRFGVFAGVLNRSSEERDSAARSRGLLVLDVLAAGSARAAAGALGSLPQAAYNPFNLFVGDAVDAFAVTYEGAPRVRALSPGVHVFGNRDPDDLEHPKTGRLFARAEKIAVGPAECALEELERLCRAHEPDAEDPRLSACVHAGRYGTRSSALLRLAADPREDRFLFADGPPCETPYEDFTTLLRELGAAERVAAGETEMRKSVEANR